MKLLVVGGGGREHAIVRKLRESPKVTEIYCAPGNGGIANDAVCVDIKATDTKAMVQFALEKEIDFAVIAPDDPLVMGMADAMRAVGIACFGPSAMAARIEGSKVFAKELMQRYGIPTAGYAVFDDAGKALEHIRAGGSYPVVIKADGLALGKGVIIAESEKEAAAALREMLVEGKFGTSGSRVVVEEFLTGPEVSVLAFTDGKTVVPMASGMDHKRALDGDLGLNTGGMGAIAPNPCYTAEIAEQCMNTIFIPTVRAMQAEGCPFSGCLYFGLMLTPKGPRVIEYNCRFGDPETQVVLPLLKTDLLEVMQAVSGGRLDSLQIEQEEGAAACIVLASGGYPQSYKSGLPIEGLTGGQLPNTEGITVFHAGTRRDGEKLLTAGGRVLGVTAVRENLPSALAAAYEAASRITFEGVHMRTDIGKRALEQLK